MRKVRWMALTALALGVPAVGWAFDADPGPLTPYGETAAEAGRKLELFKFYDLAFRRGNPDQAFSVFVSPDFKDYSHLLTRDGQANDYAGRLALVKAQLAKYQAGQFPLPYQASVDNEMVTIYSGTPSHTNQLDVYRIHDGRIVEHWDAEPAQMITIPAHAPGTAQRVMSNTPMKRPALSVADLTPPSGSDQLRGPVPTGPLSPYGETAAETEVKKIPFEETQISWVQGNFPAAIKRYVADDFKNYGHLGTHGKVDYVGPDRSQLNPPNYGAMLKQHIKLGLPQMATVDGNLVAMFGQGVDLVEVQDGKEVARWDASPPLTTVLEPPPAAQ